MAVYPLSPDVCGVQHEQQGDQRHAQEMGAVGWGGGDSRALRHICVLVRAEYNI